MISGIILFLAAAAAQASVPAPNSDAATPKQSDPIVCERFKEVGSMLRSKKVCMTRSQWAEQRRNNRADIERSQVQRGTIGN